MNESISCDVCVPVCLYVPGLRKMLSFGNYSTYAVYFITFHPILDRRISVIEMGWTGKLGLNIIIIIFYLLFINNY